MFDSRMSLQKNPNQKGQRLFLVLTHLCHICLLCHLVSMTTIVLPINGNAIYYDSSIYLL